LDSHSTFKDPLSGKTHTLLTLPSLTLTTQFERGTATNDPTAKFSLTKKDKKASNLLMQLQFSSSDMDSGQLQPFERKILEASKQHRAPERNVFMEEVAQRFKIQLVKPVGSKKSSH
jgi:hypothetical protein